MLRLQPTREYELQQLADQRVGRIPTVWAALSDVTGR